VSVAPAPLPGPRPALRPYRDADRERCLALFDALVGDYFAVNERPLYLAFLDTLADRGATAPPYFVVERDGEIVGCGGYAVDPESGAADMCWGLVRRDLHGAGIGRLLTQARLDAIRATPGVRRVRMTTSPLVDGFYRKLGFRTLRVRPDGLGPGLDAVDMELELELAPVPGPSSPPPA
jgi:ribosomal protein S18 acetylase RimI-like enzyme